MNDPGRAQHDSGSSSTVEVRDLAGDRDATPGEHADSPVDTPAATGDRREPGGAADASVNGDGTCRSGWSGRWWFSVAAGVVVSVPMGWLLSHAAVLPFLLGLFFYVLFGLLIGATMHRLASPRRPYSRTVVLVGTTVVVLVGWLVSLGVESHNAPVKMAAEAGDRTRRIGERTIQEFRADVAGSIRRLLDERYPPGGTLGYARWLLTSGEWKKGEIAGFNRSLKAPQRGFLFAIRVVLSIALLAFGIGSQTFLLRLPRDPAVRAIDRADRTEPSG